jgi:glycosidase
MRVGGVLHWLGIDAIWISPIYPSPMADFGYDISNYCEIDPLFGTMEEFDELVREAHRRALKIILDYVGVIRLDLQYHRHSSPEMSEDKVDI